MLLDGKVILVTGSSTGIGESTARRAVAEGARVMVHGRNAERARAVAEDLGDAAAYVVGDVADPTFCERVVQATVEHFGRIDGLVNNAALTTRATLEESDAGMIDTILAVNLRAPLLTARAAVPHFRAQGGGVLVNIGSINALSGAPNLLPYSAAKGGLQTASRNLANALATEKIRVIHLNVGWVTSPNEIALKQSEGLPEGWQFNVDPAYAPTGMLTTPEQIASHVVFWLSDESAPANGVVYEVEQYSLYGRNNAKRAEQV